MRLSVGIRKVNIYYSVCAELFKCRVGPRSDISKAVNTLFKKRSLPVRYKFDRPKAGSFAQGIVSI